MLCYKPNIKVQGPVVSDKKILKVFISKISLRVCVLADAGHPTITIVHPWLMDQVNLKSR